MLAAPLLICLALAGCDGPAEVDYADTTEFQAIESGAQRFERHFTNSGSLHVYVDRRTGVCYLSDWVNGGLCPLLDADGTPMLVDEAGAVDEWMR